MLCEASQTRVCVWLLPQAPAGHAVTLRASWKVEDVTDVGKTKDAAQPCVPENEVWHECVVASVHTVSSCALKPSSPLRLAFSFFGLLGLSLPQSGRQPGWKPSG